MKIRIVALLLASATLLFANSQFFMGMRNQRFLFAGIQYGAYGVAYEQSLFNQDKVSFRSALRALQHAI